MKSLLLGLAIWLGVLCSASVLALQPRRSDADGDLNVMGGPLEPCSTGVGEMASTGFERNGKCKDSDDDSGSHHICFKILPAAGSEKLAEFCTATHQSWCGEKMPCQGRPNETCPIKNWCICQWAFAAFVEEEGCEKVEVLKCEATNQKVCKAYEVQGDNRIRDARRCLREKCPGACPNWAKREKGNKAFRVDHARKQLEEHTTNSLTDLTKKLNMPQRFMSTIGLCIFVGFVGGVAAVMIYGYRWMYPVEVVPDFGSNAEDSTQT